jgi:D-arabinose 1-dehydrogenase-like Zn-dependent alcohol dehydrogenase
VKKACGCTLAVFTAQNVLMKKLGISGAMQLEASDFERYLKLLKEGLIEEWIVMIRDMFMVHTPHPDTDTDLVVD